MTPALVLLAVFTITFLFLACTLLYLGYQVHSLKPTGKLFRCRCGCIARIETRCSAHEVMHMTGRKAEQKMRLH